VINTACLDCYQDEDDMNDDLKMLMPLRLEPYVKMAKWVMFFVPLPVEHLTPIDVNKLHRSLHTQKLMGSILAYEVNLSDIKVGLYQTAEYLHADVATGLWTLRTPFEVLNELNEYIQLGEADDEVA